MIVIACFFSLLATLLRWGGHTAIVAGLGYGIYCQVIDSVAAATLAILLLAFLSLCTQLLASGLAHLALISAPFSNAIQRR